MLLSSKNKVNGKNLSLSTSFFHNFNINNFKNFATMRFWQFTRQIIESCVHIKVGD